MSNPVGWFEIYVQDIKRAKAFYETVFEITLKEMPSDDFEMLSFPMDVEKYGAPGALIRMEGIASGGNSVLVYFSCDDCAVIEQRIPGAGGSVQKPKWSIGENGFISLALDTEGNMFGLHSVQ